MSAFAKPAANIWPYPHRTVEQVDRAKEKMRFANSFRAKKREHRLNNAADFARENADQTGASNTCPALTKSLNGSDRL